MATSKHPNGDAGLTANLLPKFYQTPANKKFLQSTLDQLYQTGTVTKVGGFVGKENAKASTASDVYVTAADKTRQNYQLDPAIVIKDELGNVSYFKDYIDYINQINVFGGNTANHSRLNSQELYSWDPHINWDKFVNFQNYFWMPYGPETIKIYGNSSNITSTYTVDIQVEGNRNEYLFTPDGLTVSPSLKLYRGQEYTFEINSPGNPFSFKLLRSIGSTDRYIDRNSIDNYGVEVGTITFKVPASAPSILYYQSETDINLGGLIQIYDIEEATSFDVTTELVGKKTFTLSNGTPLSNGMKVSFGGTVTPAEFSTGEYYVEGVGDAIQLIKSTILEVVNPYTTTNNIEFDTTPFDSDPFSDSTGFAGSVDYITINRSSKDHNPWSRYNRWTHQDVITNSAAYNKNQPELDQTKRAVRPIIEFDANIRLFNFGTTATADVDLIDDYTTDVFSTIEGSAGYNVDGIQLEQGQLIVFTADPDPLVTNKIFRVEFVDVMHLNSGSQQLHLVEVASPVLDNTLLIKQGVKNQSLMYWYNGTTWKVGQTKTKINQAPLFDLVDTDGVSYSDISVYNGTTFAGTKLFSYKEGTGTPDKALGFPLSYQNVSNIGDIVFNFDLETDTFEYKQNLNIVVAKVGIGYLSKLNYNGTSTSVNGWQTCESTTLQAALRVYKGSDQTNNFDLDIFDNIDNLSDLVVRVYINGIRLSSTKWSLIDNTVFKQIVLATNITSSDILTIRAFASQPINSLGHYEIPLNLQNNPLNDSMNLFTLGEVSDHVNSIIDNLTLFSGAFPGASNLRDLGNVTVYGTKFVQHSGPASLSLYHLTSKDYNVIKAVEQSQLDYNRFKRNFISTANSLTPVTDVRQYVDIILQTINENKPKTAPYYLSDMVPYGASIAANLKVVDGRVNTYPLTTPFTLDVLSNKAVSVYLNSTQLVHGRDYTFDTQGFIVVLATLETGDVISIYEYDNTDGCFVPQTPTKLGMWPKYEPALYLDTSLLTPRWMIQGHDGSQTLAYGEYGTSPTPDYTIRPDSRDSILLEIEKRIFNNIKVQYDPSIFNIADIFPSYSKDVGYSLAEFNAVLSPNFYKWTTSIGADFTQQLHYDIGNPFTYNYSQNYAPDGQSLPGYWRGIYRWMLHTDRPHTHPWECIGFSIKPTWWETSYGPAPYTRDNLVMWQDLATGTVREPGVPAFVKTDYINPVLSTHLPVDAQGNLLDPLSSGYAQGVPTQSANESFVFGDVSPVEAAWRRSSHYPFGVLIASLLLTPAKSFGLLLDRSRIVRNNAGQLVYKDTGLRIKPEDIVLPSIPSSSTRVQTAGIVNYIVDYIFNIIFSNDIASYVKYGKNLKTMTAQLSYRVGGFSSKDKFNFLLESKTPVSSGSVFIPKEDYSLFLNTDSLVKKLTYSGVIITKLNSGFEVKGYSRTQPYFVYYPYTQTGSKINVGGISASFQIWEPNQAYAAGTILQFSNAYYYVNSAFTALPTFNQSAVSLIPGGLPMVGGVDALLRKTWDRTSPITIPYGTKFDSVQEVVDFLTGYGEWLKDQGFVFDDFSSESGTVSNWTTSAKEFLFWTTQNWSTGQDKWSDWTPGKSIPYGTIVKWNGEYYGALFNISAEQNSEFDIAKFNKLDGLSEVGSAVISLSPAAEKISFTTNLTVVDSVSNLFNTYEFFKADGTVISVTNLNSYREGNNVSYNTLNGEGIYSASFYLIQNEHVVILNNKTIFNDVIYNLPSGYRQERIKISSYVTSNWYGGLDIPGFIYDQAVITPWQAWKDYNMGDVVVYQSSYFNANKFVPGALTFDHNVWTQLAKKPEPKILTNWTNSATQFTDFYNLEADSFNANQQSVAQHLIGYQKRRYLDNIIQDDVSEFKFYQGMIREKGTQNVLNKLFDVLSSDSKDSLVFYEEWALRVGQYGANNAFENIEFILNEAEFKSNPQGVVLGNRKDESLNIFTIQQLPADIYVKPVGYNSTPWTALDYYKPTLRSAGHVNPADVFLSISNISEITSYDVTTFSVGSYVWCAFDAPPYGWNVYRFTNLTSKVSTVTYDGPSKLLTITLQTKVKFKANTYIGIVQTSETTLSGLNGFFKVLTVNGNTFTVNATIVGFPLEYTTPEALTISALVTQRASSIDDINSIVPARINSGELLWTDNTFADDELWTTWKYQPVFAQTEEPNADPAVGSDFGSIIAISKSGKSAITRTSLGVISVYNKPGVSSPWHLRHTIQPPFISKFNSTPVATIGTVIAISDDGEWAAIGSPLANRACTKLVGEYVSTTYSIDDIVSVTGSTVVYYRALQDVPAGNAPSVASPYWIKLSYLPVEFAGTNSTNTAQGVVSLYQKNIEGVFTLVDTIVSPQFTTSEKFGSSLAFGNNCLYVGAEGSGKVYKLSYASAIQASSAYNPVGSTAGIVVLTQSVGIRAGMSVIGTGFTSGQVVDGILTRLTVASINGITAGMSVTGTNIPDGVYVTSVFSDQTTQPFINYVTVSGPQDLATTISSATFSTVVNLIPITISTSVSAVTSLNTLILSGSPNSTPAGLLSFTTTSWAYDWSELYTGATANTNLVVSTDGTTLVIATPGLITVYKNTSGSPSLYYTITGFDSTFAISVAVSNTGEYIAVSNYKDLTTPIDNQGTVAVYRDTGSVSKYGTIPYQVITDHIPEVNGQFGNKIAFMNDFETLVIYSRYGDLNIPSSFDTNTTTFDRGSTGFIETYIDNGRVDVYDKYANLWVYSETLSKASQPQSASKIVQGQEYIIIAVGNTDFVSLGAPSTINGTPTVLGDSRLVGVIFTATKYGQGNGIVAIPTSSSSDGYGTGFAVGANNIFVGAPYAIDQSSRSGRIFTYTKVNNTLTWTPYESRISIPDINKIKKVFLYNTIKGELLTHLDIIDVAQGKIAGPADEEITYKTFYDPAVYGDGEPDVVSSPGSFWSKAQVGQLWWDMTTAKFINAYSNDPVYRNNIWNTLATGASIDIYEWIESSLKPSARDLQADTVAGLTNNISGKSLYGDSKYSVRTRYDSISKTFKNTYYYWVKNPVVLPHVLTRKISASDVSKLISNPRGQAYSYIAMTGVNSFSLVNASQYLKDTEVALSVEYWTIDKVDQNIHSQWKIISNDTIVSLPSNIETKWFDSLCGVDTNGRQVPDLKLPIKLRYGIENRPRQSMFVNRAEALKELVEYVNQIMISNQIAVPASLLTYDSAPSLITGKYDLAIDTNADINYVNVAAFVRPVVTPIVDTNGAISGINIVSSGKGYVVAPYITIIGAGKSAKVRATINTLGQIIGAVIENGGEGYAQQTTTCQVRDYSVVVQSDDQADYNWSIYSYDPVGKLWSRILTQAYDVRKYWNYENWYATGYSQFTAPDFAVDTFADLNSISANIGQLVKVLTANSSGWILLEKFADSTAIDWTQSYTVVGIENGTIQLSRSLYNAVGTDIGYDAVTFDNGSFDVKASTELRIILNSIKDSILVDTLKQEYLNLFFNSVRYAHSEQVYIDWIFKTSFVRATHNVGELGQPVSYPIDNLSNFQDYIAEVKPYRTKIREYISNYNKLDTSPAAITDFDLQPIFTDGEITVIDTKVINGSVVSNNSDINTYPWKFWLDNVAYKVIDLKIVYGGSGYVKEPAVVITSDSGSGATAQAFYTNGVINRIVLITNGGGYLSAPTVELVGGIGDSGTPAKIIAIIGESVVRSNKIAMKFDRLTQKYFITELAKTETFTGTGSRQQFVLQWAPDVTFGKSTVVVDGIPALRETYKLEVVKSTSLGYTVYSGKLTFTTAPASKSKITVTYNKNVSILNAADRIQYFYDQSASEYAKDLSQLMTGIDYGGVYVNGLGFNTNTGWGSLPYFTDRWDVYDESYVATNRVITVEQDGQHQFDITIPPATGTQINIYFAKNSITTYDVTDISQQIYSYDIFLNRPSVNLVNAKVIAGQTLAGEIVLIVNNTSGIKAGDVVTCNISTVFGYDTTVLSVDSPTAVTLSGINYDVIPASTPIYFTRSLRDPIDVRIYRNGTISLNQTTLQSVVVGTQVVISGMIDPVRIDDPNFVIYDTEGGNSFTNSFNSVVDGGISSSNSPSSQLDGGYSVRSETIVMPSFNGNGINHIITIPGDFETKAGDQFIFIDSTSDGSVAPRDIDYDTSISGGDLSYSTASGIAAEDIIIDGDGLVTPTTSPAPEEVVPGQVVDAVAIKIFDRPSAGSAKVVVNNYKTDGNTNTFKVTQVPNSSNGLIVKLDNTILTNLDDYVFDYNQQTVRIISTPTTGKIISIFSIGFNGSNILDLDYFVGDGTTTEFITRAKWLSSITSLVYINGLPATATLFKTDNSYDYTSVVGIRFSVPPAAGALINYIIVSGNQQTFAITKTETVATDGSLTYELQYPIGDSLPNETNMIVRVDQDILQSPINSYFTIGSNRLNYQIDPTKFLPYTVNVSDVVVLAGGTMLETGTDYTVDTSGITVKINKSIYKKYSGKQLVVSVITDNSYFYNPVTKEITFREAYDNTHIVEVISSYKHDILDIERTSITLNSALSLAPDSVEFYNYSATSGGNVTLDRFVLNDNYVWIVKSHNGSNTLLTPSVDYKLNDDRRTIKLLTALEIPDRISIMTFSSNVLSAGIAYMQFKDMLNRVSYKRLSVNKQTTLVSDLNWNDTTIIINDGSNFSVPNTQLNRPGIIEIRGERIEYFSIISPEDSNSGNWELTRLRRGTLGTGVSNLNRSGTIVQDIGYSETVPYKDTESTNQYISDGTHFVNLDFTPSSNGVTEWFTSEGYKLAGEYSLTKNYDLNDVVSYNNVYYKNVKAYSSLSPIVVLRVVAGTIPKIICSSTTTLTVGDPIMFNNSLGGLTGNITYYVANIFDTTSFNVSLLKDGAVVQFITNTVTAGNFIVGNFYTIDTVGSTDWLAAGAGVNPQHGTQFIAISTGAGSGTVTTHTSYGPVTVRLLRLTSDTTYWLPYETSIPVGYGQTDEIEVFVGGYNDTAIWESNVTYAVGSIVNVGSYTYRCVIEHTSSALFSNDSENWQFFIGNIRLKKKPFKVHNVDVAQYSPAGDVTLDADFAVDGTSAQLRLTHLLDVGTQITVVKRTGTAWDGNKLNPVNIQLETTKIAEFLKATPGIWYTEYNT